MKPTDLWIDIPEERLSSHLHFLPSPKRDEMHFCIDRFRCLGCGVSWPTDAPELSCTCPPNADTGARAREGI